jgi:hypothetical protein
MSSPFKFSILFSTLILSTIVAQENSRTQIVGFQQPKTISSHVLDRNGGRPAVGVTMYGEQGCTKNRNDLAEKRKRKTKRKFFHEKQKTKRNAQKQTKKRKKKIFKKALVLQKFKNKRNNFY